MTVKAVYLETLDMAGALRQVESMKANAERLAREQAERSAREHREAVEANVKEQRADARRENREAEASALAAELAAEVAIPEPVVQAAPVPALYETTLWVRGSKGALEDLKRYMSSRGIAYDVVRDYGEIANQED
jgi:hypothetical protein